MGHCAHLFLCLLLEPKSVIRDCTDYVRMSSSLSAAFAEGVAGYAEEKRRRRCRQSTEIKSVSNMLSEECCVGGLMTDLGLN